MRVAGPATVTVRHARFPLAVGKHGVDEEASEGDYVEQYLQVTVEKCWKCSLMPNIASRSIDILPIYKFRDQGFEIDTRIIG